MTLKYTKIKTFGQESLLCKKTQELFELVIYRIINATTISDEIVSY